MSEQERPNGRPQTPQDFSLPSLGEQIDDDGRPKNASAPRRRAKKSFDPTQYVQGQPAQAVPENGRNKRHQTPEPPIDEDLPPPTYQPRRANSQPETTAGIETQAESVASESSLTERIVVRPEQRDVTLPYDTHIARDEAPIPQTAVETVGLDKRGMGKVVNIAGAVTSIALVLGLGFWGYRLAVRDVSGVPVVAAMEGPSRIQPEDPGGELATHFGLAVNSVQSDGEAEATADRLVLAPNPVEVREGDGVVKPLVVPVPATPSIDATKKGDSEEKTSGSAKTESTELKAEGAAPDTVEAAVATPEDIEKAPVQEIVAPKPLDVSAAANEPLEEAVKETSLDIIPSTILGVSKSVRPLGRPEDFAKRVETQLATVKTATPESTVSDAGETMITVQEIDPDSLPVGTNLTQLGAYPSEEIAKQKWNEKASLFEDYMAGKARVIQKAESGGRAFYRLRAHGFENINEARQFCSALQAEGAECISVVVRK